MTKFGMSAFCAGLIFTGIGTMPAVAQDANDPVTAHLKSPEATVHVWLQSSLERIFPQSPAGTTSTYTLEAPRNGKVSFQIGLQNPSVHVIKVDCLTTAPEDINVRVRRVGYVPMRHHTIGTRKSELDGVGYLPGLVPDPLFPESTTTLAPFEAQAFWVTVDVPASAKPGMHELPFAIKFPDGTMARLAANVNVHEFTIEPRKDFPVTHWWRPSSLYNYYDQEPWSDEWFAMAEKYIRNMVEHGSNCILVPALEVRREVFRRPSQMLTITKEGDKYHFDYSVVKRFVDMAKDAGMEYFEWPHLWIYWGVKNPMVVYKKVGDKYELFFPLDSDGFSAEYQDFLKQYLDALHAFIQKEGIEGNSFFHLSDEPGGGETYERYVKARGILKDLAPWMKVMDALSNLEYGKSGVTDIPVPLIVTAPQFKAAGIDHWVYYCCSPKGDYLNRFMDTPLEKVRMTGMILYRMGAKGFLHWGYNYWDKMEQDHPLDVYCHGDSMAWPMIPYGDPFVVYPGTNGPNDSTRWEIFAEALQDYAILQTAGISPDDPMLAPIKDYKDFPRSEGWILKTVEKAMSRGAAAKK